MQSSLPHEGMITHSKSVFFLSGYSKTSKGESYNKFEYLTMMMKTAHPLA